MKNILIYPYDGENYPYFKFLKWEKCHLISPPGWGYVGNSVEIDENIFKISADFETKVKDSDIVWFVNSRWDLDYDKYIYPRILLANQLKKKIIITRVLTEEQKNILKKIITCDRLNMYEEVHEVETNNIMYPINSPIVCIAGANEYCNIIDIQMYIHQSMLSSGYNIVSVVPEKEGVVLGLPVFPSFMSAEISEQRKIVQFNHYIKNIEEKYHPELIVVGIPGALYKVNNYYLGNMGITAYEVAQATPPDYVIINTMFQRNGYEDIRNNAKNIFNREIDAINICDKILDEEKCEKSQDTIYVSLNPEYVKEKLKNYDNIYHLSDIDDKKKLLHTMLDALEQNAYIGGGYIV